MDTPCLESKPSEKAANFQKVDEDPSHKVFDEALEEEKMDTQIIDTDESNEELKEALEIHEESYPEVLEEALVDIARNDGA